jgi:hypothetical protein
MAKAEPSVVMDRIDAVGRGKEEHSRRCGTMEEVANCGYLPPTKRASRWDGLVSNGNNTTTTIDGCEPPNNYLEFFTTPRIEPTNFQSLSPFPLTPLTPQGSDGSTTWDGSVFLDQHLLKLVDLLSSRVLRG